MSDHHPHERPEHEHTTPSSRRDHSNRSLAPDYDTPSTTRPNYEAGSQTVGVIHRQAAAERVAAGEPELPPPLKTHMPEHMRHGRGSQTANAFYQRAAQRQQDYEHGPHHGAGSANVLDNVSPPAFVGPHPTAVGPWFAMQPQSQADNVQAPHHGARHKNKYVTVYLDGNENDIRVVRDGDPEPIPRYAPDGNRENLEWTLPLPHPPKMQSLLQLFTPLYHSGELGQGSRLRTVTDRAQFALYVVQHRQLPERVMAATMEESAGIAMLTEDYAEASLFLGVGRVESANDTNLAGNAGHTINEYIAQMLAAYRQVIDDHIIGALNEPQRQAWARNLVGNSVSLVGALAGGMTTAAITGVEVGFLGGPVGAFLGGVLGLVVGLFVGVAGMAIAVGLEQPSDFSIQNLIKKQLKDCAKIEKTLKAAYIAHCQTIYTAAELDSKRSHIPVDQAVLNNIFMGTNFSCLDKNGRYWTLDVTATYSSIYEKLTALGNGRP